VIDQPPVSVDVSAVVFDLDGTLLDHRRSTRAGLTTWLAGFGTDWSEGIEQAWFTAEEKHFGAWRRGEISHDEQRRRRLRDFLPAIGRTVGSDDELDDVFRSYLDAYRQSWVGFDDVDAAVDAVQRRGLRTGVLTNGTRELQEAKLAHLGLLERIGPVVCAADIGVAKPHADAFARLCDRLGLEAGRVLYVGDEHEVDIVGARAAGLRAVLIDRGQAEPVDEPDSIRSLAELDVFLDEDRIASAAAAGSAD
jgi:putative hydrolase of the HAD superfamily